MNLQESDIWYPGGYEKEHSEIARFMNAVGVDDYDDLRAFSLENPPAYWQAVSDYCRIVWDKAPEQYIDIRKGDAFAEFFPDGRLNWVNSVLGWSRRAETRDRIAVVGEHEDGAAISLTYAGLDARVRDFAAGLLQCGLKPGERVGLLMENGVEATISLLGIAAIGAVVVPLFSGFGVEPIVARLSSAQATTVLATSQFSRRGKVLDVENTVREAWRDLPELRRIIWKGETSTPLDRDTELNWADIENYADGTTFSPLEMASGDPFMVIYTSGTTGKPKGIVHTHGGFPIKIAHDAVMHFDVRPGDVFCWPADMGWIAGTLVLCSALLRGASLVCYDGAPDYPDWSRMSKLIERHRITHFGSAPTLIRGLTAHEGDALKGDTSSVRLLITAGEAIDREHFSWFRTRFSGNDLPLINYTGGTEVSGALLSSVLLRPIVPGGFNTVSPGVDADVTDGEGNPVGNGQIGELVIRSPFVGMTHSFWNDEQRYLETYWQTIPGLWVHGDLVAKAQGGHYFVVGRSDDTIKVAGKRLGPAEVEDIALEFPEISEAAAIGVDDAQKGQKLVLFVVPDGDMPRSGGDLSRRLAEEIGKKLGRPFKPGKVHLVKELPKTRSSKIMRRVIRSIYCGKPAGDLSSLDNPSALDEIRSLGIADGTND